MLSKSNAVSVVDVQVLAIVVATNILFAVDALAHPSDLSAARGFLASGYGRVIDNAGAEQAADAPFIDVQMRRRRMRECTDAQQPQSPATRAINKHGCFVAATSVGCSDCLEMGSHGIWLVTFIERPIMLAGFTRLSDHEPTEQPAWLWAGRIPLGAITIFEGDPGTNKTTLANHIAAKVTVGKAISGGSGTQTRGGVLLLQGEDSIDRVCGSLDANGADLKRAVVVNRKEWTSDRPLLLPDQISMISAVAEEIKAKFIVIDPVDEFFSGDLSNDDVARKSLKPVAEMAEEKNLAVVLIRHFTKNGSNKAMYRGRGSIRFSAIARSILTIGIDPTNPNRRIVAQSKSNAGPLAKSLTFEPVADEYGRLCVEWSGESDITADDLVQSDRSEFGPARSLAICALVRVLADGPVGAKKAEQIAMSAGVSKSTVRRAKKLLGIVTKGNGSGPGTSYKWELPAESELVKQVREKLGLPKPKKTMGKQPQAQKPAVKKTATSDTSTEKTLKKKGASKKATRKTVPTKKAKKVRERDAA